MLLLCYLWLWLLVTKALILLLLPLPVLLKLLLLPLLLQPVLLLPLPLQLKEEFRQPESNATVIGTLDVWDSKTPLSADDCEVPFYKDVHLSAGNGFSDDIEDYNGYKLRFSKSTLRRHGINPADVVCVCADGDSMEPVFPDGATLGINTADKVIKDGKIYAVNHGGLLRTKILQKLPDNKIRIKSYNSEAYPDEEADADEMNIIGRVFWWSVIA